MSTPSGHNSIHDAGKETAVHSEKMEAADESAVAAATHISQLTEEARPQLWTRCMFRLYGVLVLGYLCIVLQGYDGSLMGAINAMVRTRLLFSLSPFHSQICSIG